jgi:DNA-binding MarR family transcriptional regulator
VTVKRDGKRPAGSTSAEEKFPPLSTSLPQFLKEGSDRTLRKIIYELTSLSGLMIQNRGHFAAYIGVTDAQYMMMALIAEDANATVGRLADGLGVSSQFVTVEVAKLMKSDIVEKRANPDDRRSMLLALTPKGQALLRELGPVRRRTNDLTFQSLTAERAALLQETLAALIADARIALHQLESPQMRGKRAPSAPSEIGRGKDQPADIGVSDRRRRTG